jgi:hypothetical protein
MTFWKEINFVDGGCEAFTKAFQLSGFRDGLIWLNNFFEEIDILDLRI